jgi:hypothetical protein
MSRRTFFRSFTGKDELVLTRLVESGESVAEALRERPTTGPVWMSLRRALDEGVVQQEAWADHPRSRLSTLLDQAMAAVTA